MEHIIENTLKALRDNPEWRLRYDGYLNDIWKNKNKYKRNFRKPRGLSLYTTIGDRNKLIYYLRFKGQNVGRIKVKGDNIYLKSLVRESSSHDIKDCPLHWRSKEVEWNSYKARKFRSFFNKLSINTKTKSPEHFVENSLLQEFAKKDGSIKALKNIQPVCLHDCFFQMPTPFQASLHKPKYVKQLGGGIDILARIKNTDGSNRLCVMEIKDENKSSESQKDAMSQAIIYATFIAQLIEHNPEWLEIFAEHEEKKDSTALDSKNIEVVTVMPKGNTETFENQILNIPGTNIKLHCHSLYYDPNEFENHNKFVFSGTLIDEIKQ